MYYQSILDICSSDGLSNHRMDFRFSVIVRRMDSRSIFDNFRQIDVRVAILGLGFVDFSWGYNGGGYF